MDQFPSPELIASLRATLAGATGILLRESRLAERGTIALALRDEDAGGPRHAFIDGNEFCHLHPAPHGSIHLTLPSTEVEGVIALGWAEPHPIHNLGAMKTLVLVYGPRTPEELEVAISLCEHSCRFARGLIGRDRVAADAIPVL